MVQAVVGHKKIINLSEEPLVARHRGSHQIAIHHITGLVDLVGQSDAVRHRRRWHAQPFESLLLRRCERNLFGGLEGHDRGARGAAMLRASCDPEAEALQLSLSVPKGRAIVTTGHDGWS